MLLAALPRSMPSERNRRGFWNDGTVHAHTARRTRARFSSPFPFCLGEDDVLAAVVGAAVLDSLGPAVPGAFVSALGGCDLGFFSFEIFSFCAPFETSFFFFSTEPSLAPLADFGALFFVLGADSLGLGTDSVSPAAGDLVSS